MHPLEYLFVLALILYTAVIWFHRITDKLSSLMVFLFGLGLVADASGTLLLCGMGTVKLAYTLHTVSGLVSLAIMACHFVWALFALWAYKKSREYFNRYSLSAWVLWLIAFVSGIPLHR